MCTSGSGIHSHLIKCCSHRVASSLNILSNTALVTSDSISAFLGPIVLYLNTDSFLESVSASTPVLTALGLDLAAYLTQRAAYRVSGPRLARSGGLRNSTAVAERLGKVCQSGHTCVLVFVRNGTCKPAIAHGACPHCMHAMLHAIAGRGNVHLSHVAPIYCSCCDTNEGGVMGASCEDWGNCICGQLQRHMLGELTNKACTLFMCICHAPPLQLLEPATLQRWARDVAPGSRSAVSASSGGCFASAANALAGICLYVMAN